MSTCTCEGRKVHEHIKNPGFQPVLVLREGMQIQLSASDPDSIFTVAAERPQVRFNMSNHVRGVQELEIMLFLERPIP